MNNLTKFWMQQLFIILFFSFPLFSFVYEDAEDKQVKRWKIIDNTHFSKVDNILDKGKSSRVIELFGEGTKSIFSFPFRVIKGLKQEELQWEMNYKEDFVIIIELDTFEGKRYLVYTSGVEESYLQYGLGRTTRDGLWHKYHRNLKNDLQKYEPYNQILTIETFVIKGSGRLDNIIIVGKEALSKRKRSKKRVVKRRTFKHSTVRKKKSSAVAYKRHNASLKTDAYRSTEEDHMPTIKIRGNNPLYLRKGDNYFDPGATAMDREDGSLEISIIEKVNPYMDGEYSVIYMATDSKGNSVVKTRYIIVGDLDEASTNSTEEVLQEEEESLESDKIELDLDQGMLDILQWEKELELTERKIHEEDQTLDKYKNIKKQ